MSDEPRRKRKWDSQGEDDSAVKKLASEDSVAAAEGQNGTTTATSAEAAAAAAAAAAAIAAAKINAMLVAKGQAPVTAAAEADGSQAGRPTDLDESGAGSSGGIPSSVPIKESKERDEFVADIDINDVKHRYILTKGGVQTQIQRDTGADVTTRGQHYTDRSLATEKNPPLYLHVTALTQESLDLAVKKINELIEEAQNPAPLPPQRESPYPQPRSSGPPRHLGFHARVAIGIESERMFNVRAKIVGPQGQYVKHVQNETRTRVQLKGYGSGYLEADTGRESDEPLYINILGNTQEDVDAAERLCKDLVETVKGEYTRMKSRPPAPQEPYGHGRHYGGRSSHYNGGSHHQSHYQGGQQHHYQQPPPSRHEYSYNQQYHAQPPPPPPGVAAPPSNPPLPPGPPPPPSTEQAVAAPASAPGTSAAAVDPAAQGYTYDQYEAYNQYYYQQQYYQQYGQYYQQAYAQPGAEQTQSTGAEGSGAPAAAPVSVDPALAYYGYAYAPPPPPPAEAPAEATASSAEAAGAPPPPPPPSSDPADAQPSS
ncbi:hypothetical protein BGZ72_004379 [Mortierella alpina]|nr:hypothetical protein BGZ72_004379 [Mortierella alpina]